MHRLELTTFGGVDIRINDRPIESLSARKTQALLVYLAVTGQKQSRQTLAGLLWPDIPEENALLNLRVALARSPNIKPYLTIKRRSLAINPNSDLWLDVREFESCLGAAKPTLGQLQRAATLYRGHFLDDFIVRDAPLFEEWVQPLQERYRQLAMEALYSLAKYHTEQRHYSTAIDFTNRLLLLEPWMEEAHRQLMLVLALSGQRIAALTQYETCREMLWEELGVEPAADTTNLYNRILREEILPDSEPLAVQPGRTIQETPVQIPGSTEHFVGRSTIIKSIVAALTAGEGNPLQALVGMGGAGKSTLAVQVARAVKEAFPDGILWANVAASEPKAVLESWAAAYGYDFTRIADLDSMAAAFRGILAGKRVLLVLDDVTSPARIRPLLPGEEKCRLLMTTRDQDSAQALNARVWPVRELSPENGRLLLASILGEARVAAEPEAADTICALLQNLPLAVEITAQRLKTRTSRLLSDMAQRLRDETQRLSLLESKDQEVRASFAVSWESLDAERQRVFSLIGLFEGRSFTAEAIAHIADLKRFNVEDRLFDLVNLSLLREEGERRYSQHSLLADFAKEQLSDGTAAGNGRFADYYLIFADKHQRQFDALRPEWDNLKAALQASHEHKLWQVVIGLVQSVREFCFRQGRFSRAREAYQWAYEAALALDNTAQAAECLLWWGKAAVEQHDHDEALRLFEQSCQLFVQLGDSAGVATCQCEIAQAALEKSRFDEAITLLKDSRQIRHALQDAAGIAETYYLEARVAYFRGEFRQARQLAAEALLIQDKLDDKAGLINTLSLSASTAIQLKSLDIAEQFAERAAKLCDEIDNQSDKAIILDVFADIYRQRGQFDKAEQFARESLEMVKRFGDLGSQAQVLYQLSRISLERGQFDEALEVGRESIALSLDLNYKMLEGLVAFHLGRIYLAMNKPERAKEHFIQALDIGRQHDHETLISKSEEYLDLIAQFETHPRTMEKLPTES